MSFRSTISIVLLCLATGVPTVCAQTTQSAATQGASTDILFDAGRVRVALPAEWTQTGDPDPKGLKATLKFEKGAGAVGISVDFQQDTVVPEHARRMAKSIGDQIRAAAKSSNTELLYGPRVEDDKRFFLKINTRMNVPDRGIVDESHIYRVMGSELVYFNVTIDSSSIDEARAIRESAENLLASAREGSGPRPSSFPRTRIRVFVPADWKEQRTDNPNGNVAVFSEPDTGPARIVIKSRVLPKEARTDAGKRDARIAELEKSDATVPPAPRLKPVGEAVSAGATAPVLRATCRAYELNGKPWKAEMRYLQMGDVVLSIAATAPEESAMDLAGTVDEMAQRVESLDRTPAGS